MITVKQIETAIYKAVEDMKLGYWCASKETVHETGQTTMNFVSSQDPEFPPELNITYGYISPTVEEMKALQKEVR